ncbi:MAG: hypothetical protein OEY29_15840 [Gammaproteobacteria bacterium]|nr:hypothetical protein [Gammaproteobacteria bacterium]
MKGFVLFVLVSFSPVVQSDPFNIFLPFKTQYAPGVMGQMEMAFVLDYETPRYDYDTRIQTPSDFDSDSVGHLGVVLGFAIGLGYGFEFEIGTAGSALKYDFANEQSSRWKKSIVVNYSYATSNGHYGAVITNDESCCLFDFSCFISDIFSFSFNEDYEYDYVAHAEGVSLAFLQGYQLTPVTMLYLGVHYAEYEIDLEVTDNTGSGNNQTDMIETDLMALSLGVKWRLDKRVNKYHKVVVLNSKIYKDDSQHDGELDGELKLSFVVKF